MRHQWYNYVIVMLEIVSLDSYGVASGRDYNGVGSVGIVDELLSITWSHLACLSLVRARCHEITSWQSSCTISFGYPPSGRISPSLVTSIAVAKKHSRGLADGGRALGFTYDACHLLV